MAGMGLPYREYIGFYVGVSFGIIGVMGVLIMILPKDIRLFFMDRVLGISLDETGPQSITHMIIHGIKLDKESRKYRIIRRMLHVAFVMIISIIPVLIFEGCIFASTAVVARRKCPPVSLGCFVFKLWEYSSLPINNFTCENGKDPAFANDSSRYYAWCVGLVVLDQSMLSVLNQFGVCAGLVSIWSNLLAFSFRAAESRRGKFIVILCLVFSVVEIIVQCLFPFTVTFLQFATLVLSGYICSFALVLSWPWCWPWRWCFVDRRTASMTIMVTEKLATRKFVTDYGSQTVEDVRD